MFMFSGFEGERERDLEPASRLSASELATMALFMHVLISACLSRWYSSCLMRSLTSTNSTSFWFSYHKEMDIGDE